MSEYKVIRDISEHEAIKVIAGRGRRGLFWTWGNGKYIGIDNSTGDAWTEEFDTLDECKQWLKGEFDVRDNEAAEADETP